MEQYMYVKYDIDTEQLTKKHPELSRIWDDLKLYFRQQNFMHYQESGYVSNEKMEPADFTRRMRNILYHAPDLMDVIKYSHLTMFSEFRDIVMDGSIQSLCDGSAKIKPIENDKKMGRYITFDLVGKDVEKYAKMSESMARSRINSTLKKLGFEKSEYSSYRSSKDMTMEETMTCIKSLCEEYPWLAKSAKRFGISDVGEEHELVPVIIDECMRIKKDVVSKKSSMILQKI